MSSISNISAFKRTFLFFLGIVVAVFITSQEVIEYHNQQLCNETEETEESSSEEQEEVAYTLSAEVILPSGSVQLEPFQAILLGELIREQEEKVEYVEQVPLYNSPHYKVLFRQFKSPNAP